MIIDCHGHYTTVPAEMEAYRQSQLANLNNLAKGSIGITDDQIRESVEGAQIALQRERGTDLTFFSPRASAMAHHLGNPTANMYWAEHWNDLMYRVCALYPKNFIGVGMLPQFPGVEPKNCLKELERSVNELGFVGVNLNPDPSGAMWTEPPLSDRWWYPVYEKLVELDVPAMIHVSQSCNPNFHFTGAHYINADTTAFMQLLMSNVFKDFPTLKFLVPHGGGAVPYHWGRYRGLAQDNGWQSVPELMKNVFFDTCVYHYPGIRLLFDVVPTDNILFASEMVGAVRGIDPETGHYYDDTKRYVDALPDLSEATRRQVFEENALKLFSRARAKISG
ncbi:MAG: amidohydrolase [Chloroflexi bacterium]|nr:amidohydrolase [Chloroflexota bacterium]